MQAAHRLEGLALDSEYRRRWQEYHLADGRVFDSRRVNWRQVEWERVVKVVTRIEGRVHELDCRQPNFLFFMVFRWGGREAVFDGGRYVGHRRIRVWSVGWSDGQRCHRDDISFDTGRVVGHVVTPLAEFRRHIHPRVMRPEFSRLRI